MASAPLCSAQRRQAVPERIEQIVTLGELLLVLLLEALHLAMVLVSQLLQLGDSFLVNAYSPGDRLVASLGVFKGCRFLSTQLAFTLERFCALSYLQTCALEQGVAVAQ